jgi:hypothetical protein
VDREFRICWTGGGAAHHERQSEERGRRIPDDAAEVEGRGGALDSGNGHFSVFTFGFGLALADIDFERKSADSLDFHDVADQSGGLRRVRPGDR